MEDRFTAATDREPEVTLHFSNRYISFKGEAYPEDAAAFWGPIINALKSYLVLILMIFLQLVKKKVFVENVYGVYKVSLVRTQISLLCKMVKQNIYMVQR